MLVIFDKQPRKQGVKEYLEQGIHNDRNDKDKRIALIGNLEFTNKVAELARKKGYKEAYRNIVLSFEETLDAKTLENIARDFINLYMQPYHQDEYTAYAEAHLPKRKINSRGYERKNHIHIVIPKYSLKLQHQLDLGDHSRRLAEIEKIKEYLEAKYNLKSLERKKVIKENKSEILDIAKYKQINKVKKAIEDYILINIAHYEKLDDLISDLEKKLNAEIKTSKNAKTPYISIKLPQLSRAIRLKGELFSDKAFIQAKKSVLINSKYTEIKGQKKSPEILLRELQELQKKRNERILKRIKNKRLQTEQKPIKAEQTKKVKNYISYAEKLLNEIYDYKFNLNLPKHFFVKKYENTGYTLIANKKQGVKILDKGDRIVATGSNLQQQARIMVELAVAKGWDLRKIKISGSEEFKKIAREMIQQKLKELEQKSFSPELAKASVKEKQPSSYAKAKLQEAKDNQKYKELDLKTLKEVLTAEHLITALKEKGLIDERLDYKVENNRIITPIGKKLNIVDFCLKEMNLSFKETSKLLNNIYNADPKGFKGENMPRQIDWKQIKKELNPLTMAKYYHLDIKPEQISKKNDEYRIKVGNRNYNVIDYLLKEQKMSFKDITANIDNLMKLQQQLKLQELNRQIKLDERAKKLKAEQERKEQLRTIEQAKYEDLSIFLANLGYQVDKRKSSRNYRVMKSEDGDKVIIYKKDGKYHYFNPLNDKDRGDIYNFFANRGIKSYKQIADIIKGANRDIDLQPLSVAKKPYQIDQAITEWNKLYKNKENSDYSYLTDKRMINESIVKAYSHQIKSDKYGNIVVPLYLKANKFGMVGFDRRLKERKEDQPKSYINGKKGLAILQPKDFKQVENVVIAENYIDGLSYIELNKLDPSKTAVISTQGTLSKEEKESIKAYMDIAKKHAKLNNITLAMDDDKAGYKMRDELQEKLSEYGDKLKVVYPLFKKDFNDELRYYKSGEYEREKEIKRQMQMQQQRKGRGLRM